MTATLPSDLVEQDHGADDLDRALARWAAEARAGDATSARARQRWLQQQAAEGATLAALLLDLAERESPVVIMTRSGARHTGSLIGVAEDFCVVTERAFGSTLIALRAVVAISVADQGEGVTGSAGGSPRGEPRQPRLVAAGDRSPSLKARLTDTLATLAAEQSPVRLGLDSRELLTGTLLSVGFDVASVRLGGSGRRTVHVALGAIESCTAR